MIIAILLALLLIFFSYKTLRKLLTICAKERERLGPVCGKKKDEFQLST